MLQPRPGIGLTPARTLPLALQRRGARGDEVADVLALLLDHLDPFGGPREQGQAVAEAIAVACLGDNHLWQDLGLASRGELSALMRRWFPGLVARNSGDMKWKKFLYRQLCEREDILICKSPSCAVCSDHPVCFGPETASRSDGSVVLPSRRAAS